MNPRKELDYQAGLYMLLLCGIWGFQQIALKAAGAYMAPILQIGLRSVLASLGIGLYLRYKGYGLLPDKRVWPAGFGAGILFSLEYIFVGEGLRYTSAAHMTVMLYTAPAFAALGLHFLLPEERLKSGQWLGMGLAFTGIALMFYSPLNGDQALYNILWGDFLGLLGGLAWGATTVLIRKSSLAESPPAQTVFMQLISAVFILLPASALLGRLEFSLNAIVLGSLAFQSMVVSFFSFLFWVWLLQVYLASRLGVLTFMTPIFAVIFSVLILHEEIDRRFIIGTLCIILGIVLVSVWQSLAKYCQNLRSKST